MRKELVLMVAVLLLWIACEVGYALLEDTGYGAIPDTAGFVLLSCYLFYCIRKKFSTAMNAQPGMEWTSVAVIFGNVSLLSAILSTLLYYFFHNEKDGMAYAFTIHTFLYIIPCMYFVLMADLALLRKWKSAIFHIRSLLIWAIVLDVVSICLEVMDDDVKVAWLHWVDVLVFCAITIVYILGFIKTFGAKAKLSFPVEERKTEPFELFVLSTIVGGIVIIVTFSLIINCFNI